MSRFGEGDFFSDDDEHHSEYDHEFDEDHEEIEHEAILSAIPADLVNQWKLSEMGIEDKKLNHALLKQAVQTCEQTFLWRFRRLSTKVRMINALYFAMTDLVKGEE